jgi:hypothetical protein
VKLLGKEQMKHSFQAINFIFTLCGCQLYPSSCSFITFVNHTIPLPLIFGHLATIYFAIPSKMSEKTYILESFREIIQQIMSILFMFVVKKKRKNLVKLLDYLSLHLSPTDFAFLKRYSFILSIPYLSSMVINFWDAYYWILAEEKLVEQVVWYIVQFTGWIYGGIPCLLFILQAIKSMERNLNQRLLRDLKTGQTVTPPQVSANLKNIMACKGQLQRIFSCIPCCWFFYIFAKVVLIITRFQISYFAFKKLELIAYLRTFESVIIIFLLVYLLFVAESMLRDSKTLAEKLSVEIIKKDDIKKWCNTMIDLETTRSFEFTAWDLFVINKRLILSFTSSLVTFTVLFVQLVSD